MGLLLLLCLSLRCSSCIVWEGYEGGFYVKGDWIWGIGDVAGFGGEVFRCDDVVAEGFSEEELGIEFERWDVADGDVGVWEAVAEGGDRVSDEDVKNFGIRMELPVKDFHEILDTDLGSFGTLHKYFKIEEKGSFSFVKQHGRSYPAG